MPVPVRVLSRDDVQGLISVADAIGVVRDSFVAADQGRASMPPSFNLHLPDRAGELHVKGAYLLGAPVFAIKTASGFYRNTQLGLPVSDGMTLVYDAGTGALRMLVLDGGLLTELRTAAGRTGTDELTVADLTGLGIQDAAVAAFVAGRAEELGVGADVALAESDYAQR